MKRALEVMSASLRRSDFAVDRLASHADVFVFDERGAVRHVSIVRRRAQARREPMGNRACQRPADRWQPRVFRYTAYSEVAAQMNSRLRLAPPKQTLATVSAKRSLPSSVPSGAWQ